MSSRFAALGGAVFFVVDAVLSPGKVGRRLLLLGGGLVAGYDLGKFRAVIGDLPADVPLRLRGHEAVTLDRVRQVIADLPDDVPLEVAIRDDQHFNMLIGDLPVVGISVNRGPDSLVILLDVAGIS
jgi:hypothetical protein